MYSGKDYQIDTDIAIIGGGTAGLNVAMAAAERGLQVLVVDKAKKQLIKNKENDIKRTACVLKFIK